MMAESKLPFRWNSFIRADSITKDNVDYIADSNCEGVMLGIESGDRRQIADFETNLNGPPSFVALLQHSQ